MHSAESGKIRAMEILDSMATWLTDSANMGSIVGGSILVGAIVIAAVVGGVMSASARKSHKNAVEAELNSMAPRVMNVAIDASMYAGLEPEKRAQADRDAIEVDMRIRLLDRDGAAEAADWLNTRFTKLRNSSQLEQGDPGRLLDQIRDTFLLWAYEPRSGIRAFRRDDVDVRRGG